MGIRLGRALRLLSAAVGIWLASSAAPAVAAETAAPLVIRHVAVVDPRTGAIARNRTVVIERGRIREVAGASATAPQGAQMVDGSRKFLVPGFVDMHTHAAESFDLTPTFFPLLIANGVTAIREEPGPAMERAKQINAKAESGELDAPEIIYQGGEGHLFNPAISARAASEGGMPSMDHLGATWGLLLDCATDEADIRPMAIAASKSLAPPFPENFLINPQAFAGEKLAPIYRRILVTFNEDKCRALAEVFIRNHTWQTVTLIRLRTQAYGDDPMFRNDPNLIYVSPQRRALWTKVSDRFAGQPAEVRETLRAFYGLQLRVTGLVARVGVPILAGTDLAAGWVIPGFSLHQEFHELSKAGLTPLQVLQATTYNPALFFHRETTMGTVDVGRDANLVLLDADPVKDVGALDRIAGVVLKGKYLSRNDLAALKATAASAYR